ncbi:protein O-mannosyl-transferase TMTC2-like [Anneissia japonica]|uniref:protein O-mannosyl-transferase TMTC2-like n=1 Tax=Anneissia japonica TaxID=1529436 RepID=UPI0014257D3F|nr:protein O-mannosyl-transferase TMTC2-like [Anneissia japonica]
MIDLLICSTVALLVYLNTLDADFAYDDSRAIQKNQDLLPDSPISNIFYDDFWGTPLIHSGSHKSYRPICVLTFRLNYFLGGLNPFGYHLGNVLLHCLTTLLFTYTARQFLNRMFPTIFAGLLFSLHPVHTEAVAGIVGRADVGACMFFLASFLCFINYCKHRDISEEVSTQNIAIKKWLYLFGSMLFTLASMLTKEQGITVLAVNITYDMFIKHGTRLQDIWTILFKNGSRQVQEGVLSQIFCGIVLISLRLYLMGNTPPEFSPSDNPASDSNNTLTRSLTFHFLPAFNVWLMLCPYKLSFDWSMEAIPLVTSLLDVRNIATISMYLILFYTVIYCVQGLNSLQHQSSPNSICKHPDCSNYTKMQFKFSNGHKNNHHYDSNGNGHFKGDALRKRCPPYRLNQPIGALSFLDIFSPDKIYIKSEERRSLNVILIGLSLLVFPFLPATNLFFYVGFVVAERVLYIPSMGLCLLVAEGTYQLWKRNQDTNQKLVLFASVFILVLFGLRTIIRNRDWQNEEALYRSGIEINPAKAWGNLANILKNKGKFREAEQAYRSALSYRGNMADVHYNLGILLQENERYEEAISSYRMAIRCRPRLASAYLNLGMVLATLERFTEAEEVYRLAIAIDSTGLKDPRSHTNAVMSAMFNLGKLLHDQAKYNAAIDVFSEALERRPDYYLPQSLYNMLGETYAKFGDAINAERFFKESLLHKPDHVPAYLTYGNLLGKTNRVLQAEKMFNSAVELEPNNPSVYQHFAQFLNDQKRYEEAIALYQKAMSMLPDDFEIIFNLANSYRQAGQNIDAEKYYKIAVKIKPTSSNGHMNLGAILHLNGKLEEAESIYLKALQLKPDDQITQQNLRKLRKLMAKQQDKNLESNRR